MTTIEKMKKTESKEKALEVLGKDLADRLSNYGKQCSDLAGTFVGTFISITNRLLEGEFDEKRYGEWKEAAKLSYRDTILKEMKGLEEYIDELSEGILTEHTNLRALKKSIQPDYVR